MIILHNLVTTDYRKNGMSQYMTKMTESDIANYVVTKPILCRV